VQKIRIRMYFNALRDKFNRTEGFIARLSNLSRIFDHQGLKAGLNAI